MLVAQFVESLSDTAAVRLDLNDGAVWQVLAQGTKTPPPPLRRAVASTLLRDGDHVAAAAYGNRTVTLALNLLVPDMDDAAAHVQKLTREISRPAGFLRWNPGTTHPVYFRLHRSEFGAVRWDGVSRRLVVELPADPYAYGPEQFPLGGLAGADSFTRPAEVAGWGSPDVGPDWVPDVAANYSTDGTRGLVAMTAVNTQRAVTMPLALPNVDVVVRGVAVSAAPTGAPIEQGIRVRYVDNANYLEARLSRQTGGTVTLTVRQVVAGVATGSAAAVVPLATSADSLDVRVQAVGPTLRARAWINGQAEPVYPPPAWPATLVTTWHTAGPVGVRTFLAIGNTNALPLTGRYDSVTVTGVGGVRNDPAAAVNGLHFDVAGVLGDVETPAILSVPEADAGLVAGAALGVRRSAAPESVPFVAQAETWTSLSGETTLQPNSAAMSGPGQNFYRSTFGVAGMANRLILTHPAVPDGGTRGLYKAFLRYRRSSAAGTIRVQLQTSGVTHAAVTLAATTNPEWIFLGDVSIPTGSDPARTFAGVDLAAGPTVMRLGADRVSGTSNLDWDCVVLVPADDGFALLLWPNQFPDGPLTGWYVWDGAQEEAYTVDSAGRVAAVNPPPTWEGGLPMLSPGVINRLYLVLHGFGGTDALDETVPVGVSYFPRYLHVRPVTE